MKDIIGNELTVGDKVVFGMGGSMNLLQGIVTKINPKTVTIEQKYDAIDYYTKKIYSKSVDYLRTFDNVVKV